MQIQASVNASMMGQTRNNASFGNQVANNATKQSSDNGSFGDQVVSKTLETMNSNANQAGDSGKMDSGFDFQTSVLSSGMSGKGNSISKMV